MAVNILDCLVVRIRRHACAAYPNECCGLLLGQTEDNNFLIKDLREIENAARKSRRTRYLISPKDLYETENSIIGSGLSIIGIYHSHPDRPASPSSFDLKHAVMHYLYLILNVAEEKAGDMSCWIISHNSKSFIREDLLIFGRPGL